MGFLYLFLTFLPYICQFSISYMMKQITLLWFIYRTKTWSVFLCFWFIFFQLTCIVTLIMFWAVSKTCLNWQQDWNADFGMTWFCYFISVTDTCVRLIKDKMTKWLLRLFRLCSWDGSPSRGAGFSGKPRKNRAQHIHNTKTWEKKWDNDIRLSCCLEHNLGCIQWTHLADTGLKSWNSIKAHFRYLLC